MHAANETCSAEPKQIPRVYMTISGTAHCMGHVISFVFGRSQTGDASWFASVSPCIYLEVRPDNFIQHH